MELPLQPILTLEEYLARIGRHAAQRPRRVRRCLIDQQSFLQDCQPAKVGEPAVPDSREDFRPTPTSPQTPREPRQSHEGQPEEHTGDLAAEPEDGDSNNTVEQSTTIALFPYELPDASLRNLSIHADRTAWSTNADADVSQATAAVLNQGIGSNGSQEQSQSDRGVTSESQGGPKRRDERATTAKARNSQQTSRKRRLPCNELPLVPALGVVATGDDVS